MEFNFGKENSLIETYMNWFNIRGLPFIVVSGDKDVSSTHIESVSFKLQEFLEKLILELSDQEIKVFMKVMADKNSGLENSRLIDESYDYFNAAHSDDFSDEKRRYFQALICLENAKNGYLPHLDVVVTSKPLNGAWGATYPSLILLDKNQAKYYDGNRDNKWSRLIIHEFCHALGVEYENNFGDNCSNSRCLMSTHLGSINLCEECLIQIKANLLVINQDKPGEKFLKEI